MKHNQGPKILTPGGGRLNFTSLHEAPRVSLERIGTCHVRAGPVHPQDSTESRITAFPYHEKILDQMFYDRDRREVFWRRNTRRAVARTRTAASGGGVERFAGATEGGMFEAGSMPGVGSSGSRT